jgi:hypothetical protein
MESLTPEPARFLLFFNTSTFFENYVNLIKIVWFHILPSNLAA